MQATRSQLRLRSRLDARLELVDRAVRLPRLGITYDVCLPAAVAPLLAASHTDPPHPLPYWALPWPSGIALAEALLTGAGDVAGQRALELGCGLGITATASLCSGARLTVTDYASAALLLCRLNTLRNAGCAPRTLQLNWLCPRPVLFRLARQRFPLLLAADVLYDARDVAPLLDLMERLVAPHGSFWLAEPGRQTAARFVAAARGGGWRDEVTEHHGPWSDRLDQGVVVNVHRLQRAAG